MTLRQVTMADAQFLYDLLAERPAHANISHRSMPSIDEHRAFIASRPYRAWYVIQGSKRSRVGSIYLTHNNEIGIHIATKYRGKGYARRAIEQLMATHPQQRYLANIAPANQPSHQLFSELGFTHIQDTLELRSAP